MATTAALLPIIVLHSLVAVASAQPRPPMARPGCRDMCGNVTVPYPFGIGPGCFRSDDGFQLECDDSGPSPPRLTIVGRGGYRLAALSLPAGEATAYLNAMRRCYSSTGGLVSANNNINITDMGSVYLFSSSKTQLVALGCPNLGFFLDGTGEYVSGCMSVCRHAQYALSSPCTGVGCCRSAIPSGINHFTPMQKRFPPRQDEYDIIGAQATSCRYVFLVETEWFDGERVSLNRTDDFQAPAVLDWAIRNVGDCTAARRNATDFACRSAHSECFSVTNGRGYRCKCSVGYAGNPYLDNGCIDIDECAQPNMYPCFGLCKNTPGSYECSCSSGMEAVGDLREGGHCTAVFSKPAKVALSVIAGILIVAVMAFVIILGKEKRKTREYYKRHVLPTLEKANIIKLFKKEELMPILSNGNLIGKGSFGEVYKGLIGDKEVAVKKPINGNSLENEQFINEYIIQSQVIHKNIVRLMGCCLTVDSRMLVYEFISNGSLDDILHNNKKVALDLDTRLSIAAKSADGLAYMHSKTNIKILHGDVKPANILLDHNFEPKISDFGISRLIARDKEHTDSVIGDRTYMDPVYQETGLLTEKSDVYSFGVVILELITREKATHSGNNRLIGKFLEAHKKEKKATEYFDKEVAVTHDLELLDSLAEMAVECLSLEVDQRPTMTEVAERLLNLSRLR